MSTRTLEQALHMSRYTMTWLGIAALAAGCGGGSPSTTPPMANVSGSGAAAMAAPAPAQAPRPPMPVAMPKEPEAGPPLPPLAYESQGRRDPFVPVSIGTDKPPGMSVLTLRLGGVIRGRTLLALVEAPDGVGYILKPGDVLGDGRVTDITQSSVTFAVTAAKAGEAPTTATLKLKD
jgi:Tfp pilus assembly protein PilP